MRIDRKLLPNKKKKICQRCSRRRIDAYYVSLSALYILLARICRRWLVEYFCSFVLRSKSVFNSSIELDGSLKSKRQEKYIRHVQIQSCRTLSELNHLVGRHSMIHLLCVQILAFFRQARWLHQNQSFYRLNETRFKCFVCQ